ncbi:MAG: hypothetical protein IKL29_09560, partial [Bacteroidaceae bacterium]|nr:hypothetical protein [Bacteroidaceae bacterium]
GNTTTSYGLIAETIIGSLIMGERLKIKNENSTVEIGAEGITIKKADGTIVFQATPDGELIVRNYASQSSVDDLEGRMDSAEASIEVQAGQIALKASQTSVDALTKRMTSAETSITANANAIKLKASQSSVDDLEGRMDSAESEIEQNASAITAKVSKTYGSSSSSFGWSLTSSGFYIYSSASTVLKVTSSGLEVTGTITALDGSIAGWAIGWDSNLQMTVIRSPNGIQGRLSWTTTGTDYRYMDGYIFTALTPYGLAYVVKEGSSYSSTTLGTFAGIEVLGCSFTTGSSGGGSSGGGIFEI